MLIDYHMGFVDDILFNRMTINELEDYLSRNYVTKNEWSIISECQKLSWNFVHKHEENIDWYALSVNPFLNEAIIECYSDKLNWQDIAQFYRLNNKFVDRWWPYLTRESFYLAQNKTFTVEMCDKIKDNLDWWSVSKVASEEIIRAFPEYVDWDNVLKGEHGFFTEEFYREFIDYIDVYELTHQVLGYSGYKNLLREFKDRINWDKYKDRFGVILVSFNEVYEWWLNKKEKQLKRKKYK